MERNVLEYVDHLHEHFLYPCTLNQLGRYNVPDDPNGGYRYVENGFLLVLDMIVPESKQN